MSIGFRTPDFGLTSGGRGGEPESGHFGTIVMAPIYGAPRMPSDHAGARSSRAWAVCDVVSVVGVVEYQLNAIKMVEIASNVPQNVNFAIRTRNCHQFPCNKRDVSPSLAERGQKALEPAGVTEIARGFTVEISCGKN
jgi:hypothetical protein